MEKWKTEVVTTEISRFEVFLGIYEKRVVNEAELESTRAFFRLVEVLPFADDAGETAAQVFCRLKRDGETIGQNDCLIAAAMHKHGCRRILTGNKKHFQRIQGLSVFTY